MRIRLANAGLLPDLLGHLRTRGCIAYAAGEEINAIYPHLFGDAERERIRKFLAEWTAEHASAGVAISIERAGRRNRKLRILGERTRVIPNRAPTGDGAVASQRGAGAVAFPMLALGLIPQRGVWAYAVN